MDFGQFLKPVIYALLALVGLVVIITPSVSYEEAYFVGDDYYITMVDSIEVGYEPYLKGLIQAEQNVLASKEKKAFHKKLKPLADSLSLLQSKAELSKDSTRIANAKNAYFDFQEMKSKQEQLIDEKYAITKLNDAVLINKIDGLKKSLSMDDYIVIVANQIRNPNGLSTIPSVTPNDLNIQKVNLQDPGGYYIVGLILIGITLFMYFMDKGSIPIESNGFPSGGNYCNDRSCYYIRF